MKHGWLILLCGMLLGSGAANRALAKEELFYLGSGSAKSEGIFVGSIDSATGHLGPLTLAAKAHAPGFLALTRDDKFLYAVTEAPGEAASFARHADGTLVPLNRLSSPAASACFVSVDSTGRDVLIANYDRGSIACLQTKPDGSLAQETAWVQLIGSGPNKSRQAGPHAHSIYEDPSGKFVYACNLGSDQLALFKFDAQAGTLAPAEPAAIPLPAGAGPRHVAFAASGKFIYVINEMGQSVTVFARADSGLPLLPARQTIFLPTRGSPVIGDTAAEIVLHPNGHWLYASNRGPDTLSLFTIEEDGTLKRAQTLPAQVKWPRNFAIDPSGRWLISAGEHDDRIAVLKIDATTGRLSATTQHAAVKAPTCVLFTHES